MAQVTEATLGHLADLIPSWERSLRAANKAPRTRQGYAEAARQLVAFLEGRGMPLEAARLRREHVESVIEHLVETHKPATATNRFLSLQQFFRWLEEEGEVPSSPMARMRPPKVPEVPVAVLGDGELRRLLATLLGKGVRPAAGHRRHLAVPRRSGATEGRRRAPRSPGRPRGRRAAGRRGPPRGTGHGDPRRRARGHDALRAGPPGPAGRVHHARQVRHPGDHGGRPGRLPRPVRARGRPRRHPQRRRTPTPAPPQARKAYFTRLALRSAQARRRRTPRANTGPEDAGPRMD
ncbi:MAG: phage integrase N-terminal SAM-like domain-containing protein [Acidimicrobiales bacterium]